MDRAEAQQRLQRPLGRALRELARDRGCEVDDLAGAVHRALEELALSALLAGYELAHDEDTREVVCSPPRGVWRR